MDRSQRKRLITESVAQNPTFSRAYQLLNTFTMLMTCALATSTPASYATHEDAFLRFCESHGVIVPFPLTDATICGFICYYFNLGKPFSAIKQALAAIRNLARSLGHGARVIQDSLRIQLLKRSYKKLP